jgi:threonine/homoserine/homoserine lactone efflux protein
MNNFEIAVKGVLAGLIISAPVGPVNVLCISRALANGRKAGLVSGLGAATADTIYGAIAGFSIQFIIGFLMHEEARIKLCGGILLIAIGVRYFFRSPRSVRQEKKDDEVRSHYTSAFLLNLTNPTTIISFLAVLTVLRLHQHRSSLQSTLLVAGIFSGAMLWWISLALIASHFRDRFTDRAVVWMNRIAGTAIGGFGLITAALSRRV